MDLALIAEEGMSALEGRPGQPFLGRIEDTDRLIEACWSHGVHAVLLYAENLTPGFFDLRSGQAGAMLQKLQNYHIRLGVVCPPGSVTFSDRFRELMAEARHGRDFGVFDDRSAARAWLGE